MDEDDEKSERGSSSNNEDGDSEVGNKVRKRNIKTNATASRSPTRGTKMSKKPVKKKKKVRDESNAAGSPTAAATGAPPGTADDGNDTRFKDMVKQYCIKRENSILKKS